MGTAGGRGASFALGTALAGLLVACAVEPRGERPGLGLSGPVVSEPVLDWSFTSDIPEILIETRTWYGVPHSVTIWCVSIDGELYVGASAPEFPKERFWVRNVRRDPDVRLKIGGRIYERRLELITDPARTDFVDRAFGVKYDYDVDEDPDPVVYWRVAERGADGPTSRPDSRGAPARREALAPAAGDGRAGDPGG